MVCRAGWGAENTMWSELSWWVDERNRVVTEEEEAGGGWRKAGDACAMNQLSKYGPCSSLQHTHPLPVQSGWTSLLLVYILLLLTQIYYSTLLTVMEEAPRINRSHIRMTQYVSQPTVSTISGNSMHTHIQGQGHKTNSRHVPSHWTQQWLGQ